MGERTREVAVFSVFSGFVDINNNKQYHQPLNLEILMLISTVTVYVC